jgi:DNA-binding transcriptional ArsR family regulator
VLAQLIAMTDEMDKVFKALADPTRRRLLDRLQDHDGQSLNALCADLGMSRQAVTQHLAVLEAANLVVAVREGRERLHHLNPIPIQQIAARWIEKFERPRLRALLNLKNRRE